MADFWFGFIFLPAIFILQVAQKIDDESDLDWFKSDRIERRSTGVIKIISGCFSFFFFTEKCFNLKMADTEIYYFHILKADQTITRQNMWMWHVRSARNWALVISRNLHKASGAITGLLLSLIQLREPPFPIPTLFSLLPRICLFRQCLCPNWVVIQALELFPDHCSPNNRSHPYVIETTTVMLILGDFADFFFFFCPWST